LDHAIAQQSPYYLVAGLQLANMTQSDFENTRDSFLSLQPLSSPAPGPIDDDNFRFRIKTRLPSRRNRMPNFAHKECFARFSVSEQRIFHNLHKYENSQPPEIKRYFRLGTAYAVANITE
tara:strand:+ start:51 stop:410 length:360 start_codon:yes stop_codon:yes gene_type:complete